ncbi:WhiB family transcriptional regulator [Streptomyces sp. NPDC057909]|uniref:WhiB family transcriptional regulator n=1 Tax=Streptomyces sp. NPDC057909 TaxID=3346277 RepID=UPI0036E6C344
MTNSISSTDIAPVASRRLSDYRTGLSGRADWQQRAACIGADVELFFPTIRGQAERAQAVCASCPVAESCRTHAETMPEPYGIWGGTTARDRGWNYNGKHPRTHPPNAHQTPTTNDGPPTDTPGTPDDPQPAELPIAS